MKIVVERMISNASRSNAEHRNEIDNGCRSNADIGKKHSNTRHWKEKEFSTSVHYAGFAKRLKAFAFDFIPILAYIFLLFGATMAMILVAGYFGLPLRTQFDPLLGDLIAFLTLVLPVILYFTLQEGSAKGATWGKRRVGIRVMDANGETLTRGQAFLRSLVKFLPWQIAHTSLFHWAGWPFAPAEPTMMVIAGFVLAYLLVGIYIASALISNKNRTPYDWAAGSVVIKQKNV